MMFQRLLLAGFLAVSGGWAPAQESQVAGQAIRADIQPAVALAHRTERLKRALLAGDEVQTQAAAQEVELLRRRYGTLDLTPLVEALSLWAHQLNQEGRTALALKVLHEVEGRWAPHHPTLLGTRIVLHRSTGLRGYLLSLPDIWELTRIRLSHPDHRWLWMTQHAAWSRMMAAILLWGTALALTLRYRRVLRYLWEEPLSKRGLGSFAMALIGAFLLALPVILGLDPSASAFLALVLLAPFLTPSEIRTATFVVLLQLVHPLVGLLDPVASQTPAPSIVALQMQPQARPLQDSGSGKLPPDDQAFLRGWAQLSARDWAGAEATFDRLMASHPDRGHVVNNRGVARFQAGNVAGAEQDFDAAYGMLPQAPEILINQSVIAFRRLDSSLGLAKQDEARRLAPERVNALMAANQAGQDQRTFPLPLPDTPARLNALASRNPGPPGLSGHLKTPAMLAGIILPLAALALIHLRIRRSLSRAHPAQCARCGDPFHTTDSPEPSTCSRCHHLFVLKDGLHGETRRKKVEEVGAFQAVQRRLHKALLATLPGTDLLFLGRTRSGFIELAALALAFGVAVATGRTVRYPGELLPDPSSTWLPIGLLLLGILYLRSWLKLLPRRS